MQYPRSQKYNTPSLMAKIMGPNPIKLEEELLADCRFPQDAVVCDLGSGQGLTSVFLAKEYGVTVYAADLWSDPEENRHFFREMGLSDDRIIPVKADATDLPFEKEFFDAVVSTDSYKTRSALSRRKAAAVSQKGRPPLHRDSRYEARLSR